MRRITHWLLAITPQTTGAAVQIVDADPPSGNKSSTL